MQIQKVKISEVKNNPNNPRIIKDDKFKNLVKSIKDFPEMLEIRPIVVNADMIVLGGNMRLKASREAGLKEVYIIRAENLTPEQEREFIIKDNVSGGEWDWDMLANEWSQDDLENWGLDVPVFEESDSEVEDDDFESPEGGVETDIQIGDIFEIGEHRLICGDSTKVETFNALMPEELADCVVTDPPYNVAYEGKTKDALKIENDDMSDGDFYKFLFDFYLSLGEKTKAGGGLVCLARRLGRSKFQKRHERCWATCEAMFDLGKKYNGDGQARLSMEARALPLWMETGCVA